MTKKPMVVIAVAVAALLLFLAGFLIARANGKAALAEAKAQSEMDKAKLLTEQINGLSDQLARSEKALAKFQEDEAAKEKAFLAVLASVKTATPQQLVDQGSQILGVADITTDGVKVSTSIQTYRQIVTILVDWKQYKEVREPGWLVEKGMLNDQIAGFKAKEALDAQKDASLKASIADLKDYISHAKTASVFEKVLWAGAGAGIGLLAGHLLK